MILLGIGWRVTLVILAPCVLIVGLTFAGLTPERLGNLGLVGMFLVLALELFVLAGRVVFGFDRWAYRKTKGWPNFQKLMGFGMLSRVKKYDTDENEK